VRVDFVYVFLAQEIAGISGDVANARFRSSQRTATPTARAFRDFFQGGMQNAVFIAVDVASPKKVDKTAEPSVFEEGLQKNSPVIMHKSTRFYCYKQRR